MLKGSVGPCVWVCVRVFGGWGGWVGWGGRGVEEGKGAVFGRPNHSQLMPLSCLGLSLVIENRRRAVFLKTPQLCWGRFSSACENKLFNPHPGTWLIAVRPFTSIHINSSPFWHSSVPPTPTHRHTHSKSALTQYHHQSVFCLKRCVWPKGDWGGRCNGSFLTANLLSPSFS